MQLIVTQNNIGNTSIGFNNPTATVQFKFDPSSQTQINAQHAGFAPTLSSLIANQIQTSIRAAGPAPLASLPFVVDTTKDSVALLQLSQLPILRWIDQETLGMFGMYFRVPPGNPAWKTSSDLVAGERRSIALLLSANGFH